MTDLTLENAFHGLTVIWQVNVPLEHYNRWIGNSSEGIPSDINLFRASVVYVELAVLFIVSRIVSVTLILIVILTLVIEPPQASLPSKAIAKQVGNFTN